MSDDQDSYRYDKMVEGALRGVVKTALEEVIKKGLFDDHHFYITFRTDYPGVEIPDYLKDRYPGEMTIVLQHQFYDLEVTDRLFTVMLKFNNVPERLKIPLAAITIFTDPSVNFALQFQPLSSEDAEEADYGEDDLDLDANDGRPAKGEVVSLDQFRKGNTKVAKRTRTNDETDDKDAAAPEKPKKDESAKPGKDKDKDKSKGKGKDGDKTRDE